MSFLLPLAIYLATAAPGTTGYDTPELTLGAVALGVPHPPGEPLYVLLAKLATFLPVGDAPFRLTLLSAVAAAAAGRLSVPILARLLPAEADAASRGATPVAAGAAVLTLALALPVWLQAVRVEVYSLHLVTVVGLAWIALASPLPSRANLALAAGLFGLGLANHHALLIAAAPGLAVLGWARPDRSRGGVKAPLALGALALGLSAYLLLPIRSSAGAALASGSPHTWEAFIATVSGAVYRRSFSGLTADGLVDNILAHLRLLETTYGAPVLLAAAAGAALLGRRRPAALLGTALVFLGTGATTALQGLFTPDNPDALGYLAPAAWVVALWVGVGAHAVDAAVRRRSPTPAVRALSAVTLLAVGGAPGLRARGAADLHDQRGSEAFGALLLDSLPQGAVLFTSTDSVALGAAYHQGVLGRRGDVALIPQYLGPSNFGGYTSPTRPEGADGLLEALRVGGTAAVAGACGARPLFISASAYEGRFRVELRPGQWAQRLAPPGGGVPIDGGAGPVLKLARTRRPILKALAASGDHLTARLYKHNLEAVGDALLELGSLEPANRAYATAGELTPNGADISRLKGWATWQRIQALARLVEDARPSVAIPALLDLGRADAARGRIDELEGAERAWALGQIAWLEGQEAEARGMWAQALALDPTSRRAIRSSALWGDAAAASAALESEGGPTPGDGDLALLLSRALRRQGRGEEARDAVQAHLPTLPAARCELALALEMLGESEASAAAAASCLAGDPWNPEVERLVERLRMQGLVVGAPDISGPQSAPPTGP